MARCICMMAAAAVLMMTGANAESVKGAGFSAVFPCQSKQSKQQVAAGKNWIPIVSHSCEAGGTLFYVVTSTYPKGFIAKKTKKGAFADAVAGAAANVQGNVRTDTPVKLGKTAGRDAVIDIPKAKATARLRVFFVGDKQFQVMVLGAKGRETGKPATAFFKSFRLGK